MCRVYVRTRTRVGNELFMVQLIKSERKIQDREVSFTPIFIYMKSTRKTDLGEIILKCQGNSNIRVSI